MNVLLCSTGTSVEISTGIFFKKQNAMCLHSARKGLLLLGVRDWRPPAWEPGFQSDSSRATGSQRHLKKIGKKLSCNASPSAHFQNGRPVLSCSRTWNATADFRETESVMWNENFHDLSGAVDKHHTGPIFSQRFHALRTGTHSCRNLRSTTQSSDVSSVISDRKVTSDTVVRQCHWKSTL